MALIYKERGGGWMGFWLQGTWPFANLEIYDDNIVFGLTLWTIEVPFKNVRSVERIFCIPFIADGVQIRLRNQSPGFIVFWSFGGAGKIVQILKKYCNDCDTHRRWFQRPVQIFSIVFIASFFLILFLALTSN